MTNGNPGAPTTVSTHTYRLQIVKERAVPAEMNRGSKEAEL
jgi:hypothetical protein